MITGRDDDTGSGREDALLAELFAQVAEDLTEQYATDYDAGPEQARFLVWLAEHTDDTDPAHVAEPGQPWKSRTRTSGSIFGKRQRTLLVIGGATLGTGGVSAAPTIGAEVPKQGAITQGDLHMCVRIYAIWFGVTLSTEEMRQMLLDSKLATAAGAGLVYGGVKLTEGLLAAALSQLGPLGWGVPAAITGTVTGVVGLSFWMLCESPPPWLIPSGDK